MKSKKLEGVPELKYYHKGFAVTRKVFKVVARYKFTCIKCGKLYKVEVPKEGKFEFSTKCDHDVGEVYLPVEIDIEEGWLSIVGRTHYVMTGIRHLQPDRDNALYNFTYFLNYLNVLAERREIKKIDPESVFFNSPAHGLTKDNVKIGPDPLQMWPDLQDIINYRNKKRVNKEKD